MIVLAEKNYGKLIKALQIISGIFMLVAGLITKRLISKAKAAEPEKN